MNYEEKYNTALERARGLTTRQNPPAFDKDLISLVFPELKESWDEKIRNRLIAMCHHYIECYSLDPYNVDDYKEALAWLDKQGEQKPVWSEDDENFFNDTIAFFENTNTLDHSDWLKSLKQRILDVSMEEIPNCHEKQSNKESEDERIRKALIEFLKLPHPQFVGNRDHEKWIDWLEKQGEQKQTWKPSAAQLIVIKDLIEDKNTSNVSKVILRGMFDEFKQYFKL